MSESEVQIRKAQKTDFDSWAQMRFALWPVSPAGEHRQELDEFFGAQYFQAWMALKDDQYIGFAEASIRPYANGCDSRPVVFLEGIWIDPKFRRHGVGQMLVSQVENWARSLNIFEVGSDTELENLISQKSHAHWGFEETARVVYFRKKLK